MIIMSVKLNKKLVTVAAVIVAAVIVAAALIIAGSPKSSAGETAQVAGTVKVNLKSADDVSKYINNKGLKASGSPGVKEVKIPENFDDVYNEYNKIQKECGFDLEKYKGKRVKLWSCGLSGYEGAGDGTVRINIITFKDQVIGGDISSVELGGFMKGLEK